MINHKIVELLVRIRTSFAYVGLAILLPVLWVIAHRSGFLHIDNDDLTYLNLTLSILAEVQGVVLLIYSSRISQRQDQMEKSRTQH